MEVEWRAGDVGGEKGRAREQRGARGQAYKVSRRLAEVLSKAGMTHDSLLE